MIETSELMRGLDLGSTRIADKYIANNFVSQVNVPKTRRTYCKGRDCKKHTQHKVTQYKAGKVHTFVLALPYE
jgi:hypothetical protein